MLTKELQPAAINGIVVYEDGEYQFDRSDLRSRPIAVNFNNLGNSPVHVKIGGLTFRLTTNQERTFSVPFGYYLKGGATWTFESKASSTTLTISTIEAL